MNRPADSPRYIGVELRHKKVSKVLGLFCQI